MITRWSAPARLDFAGGWTDVAPFADEAGGVVVNAAIALHAHVEVELGGAGYRLRSDDLDDTLEVATVRDLPADGRLDLLKAALRLADPGPCRLRTWSEAPPGSGLGSSGALDVALMAALESTRGATPSPAEVAELGYRLEAIEAGHAGGRQDQYAAAFGGFHRFAFGSTGASVTPLQLDAEFTRALAHHIVLCYTGQSRVSGETIARVMGAFVRRDRAVVEALHQLVRIADRMADALRAGDLAQVAQLLSANWREQQRLDPGMQTHTMARLEAAMHHAGALGGKAAGAGAGGSMFFVVPDPERAVAAARSCGSRVLSLEWAPLGIISG